MNLLVKKYELEGRLEFEKYLNKLYPNDKFIVNNVNEEFVFSKNDTFLSITNRKTLQLKEYVIEIKKRNTHYDELMLEKPKYESNIKIAEKFEAKSLYFNITPKGTYVFDLSNLNVNENQWQQKMLPKVTCNPSLGKVMKSVTYLNINQSILGIFN